MSPREAYFRLTPKRIALGVVALVLLVGGGRLLFGPMFSSGETRTARMRVTELLEAVRDGSAATDVALTRWYGGIPPTDPDLLGMLSDEFDAFCTDHELRPLTGFEIRDVRATGEKDRLGAAAFLVSGVANGKPFRLRVQRGRTITWVN